MNWTAPVALLYQNVLPSGSRTSLHGSMDSAPSLSARLRLQLSDGERQRASDPLARGLCTFPTAVSVTLGIGAGESCESCVYATGTYRAIMRLEV